MEVDGHRGTEDSDTKKKSKPKGQNHGVHYEILEDPNIIAEPGWEKEKKENWTAKECKKYVKMYHIGKHWPRECHPVDTKAFTCNPTKCLNEHFMFRCEEVWRSLFGDRPKGKGAFPYILMAMVYAELILKRKVNWSTYDTRSNFPIENMPDPIEGIPTTWDPQSASTKSILEFLRKDGKGKKKVEASSNSQRKANIFEIKAEEGIARGIIEPKLEERIKVGEGTSKANSKAPVEGPPMREGIVQPEGIQVGEGTSKAKGKAPVEGPPMREGIAEPEDIPMREGRIWKEGRLQFEYFEHFLEGNEKEMGEYETALRSKMLGVVEQVDYKTALHSITEGEVEHAPSLAALLFRDEKKKKPLKPNTERRGQANPRRK